MVGSAVDVGRKPEAMHNCVGWRNHRRRIVRKYIATIIGAVIVQGSLPLDQRCGLAGTSPNAVVLWIPTITEPPLLSEGRGGKRAGHRQRR